MDFHDFEVRGYDEKSIDHRHHRAGRLLSDRASA